MIKNYLQIAIRNLIKYKGFSFINILGIAIGFCAFLLITYYVKYEESYDVFQPNADRIYRLRYERSDQYGEAVRFASCCPPAGLKIRQLYPEAEKVARIFRFKASVSHKEKVFFEERMYFAEPDFFQIFKYKFISGDAINGLKEPNKAFISQSTARKYFGNENPIGKTISIDKKTDYQIAGIFEDIPSNSHLKFDIMLSYKNLIQRFGVDVEDSWGDSGWFTYILMKNGTDANALQKKLPALVETEFGEALRYYKLTCDLIMQPLKDIHLNSHYQQEYEVNGNKDTVDFLSIIAILILIIAWVNYINLSSARSLTRAKEVGLRKVVGASRTQLVFQFLFETAILNIIAIILAFILLGLFLPVFRDITEIPIEYGIWTESWFWRTISIILVISIVLSGLYPVVVLSSFKPITVLKGNFSTSTIGIYLRRILVSFQFLMSLILLICTFAVYNQLSFMKTYDLGFNKNQKLIIKAPRVRDTTFISKLQVFKEQLINNSYIINFSVATDVPGRQTWWDAGAIHQLGVDNNKNYQIIGMDYDYANVFELKFASGRNFSKEFPSDSNALILNETSSKWLGFKSPQQAIGKTVVYWDKNYQVVGVLKDYHQQSIKQAFEPHIFRLSLTGRDVRGVIAMTVKSDNIQETIQVIKKNYMNLFPSNPFDYFFLDEYYNEQYKEDELLGDVFGIFSLLAIFVTSLGILGLSSFMVIQRKKEISIRKVLGSSILGIFVLLSKNFIIMIFIAYLFAIPVSYYLISYWLESFAKRMTITIDIFIFPILIVMVITLLTIIYHIIRAAKENPINNLRCE